jgi:hypothetical protein
MLNTSFTSYFPEVSGDSDNRFASCASGALEQQQQQAATPLAGEPSLSVTVTLSK